MKLPCGFLLRRFCPQKVDEEILFATMRRDAVFCERKKKEDKMLHETMTEEQLKKAVGRVYFGNFQDAAIAAFVLAKRAKEMGDKKEFLEYSLVCLACIKKCDTDTLEGCVHTHVRIAGVFIPELFHEGTVRRALESRAV